MAPTSQNTVSKSNVISKILVYLGLKKRSATTLVGKDAKGISGDRLAENEYLQKNKLDRFQEELVPLKEKVSDLFARYGVKYTKLHTNGSKVWASIDVSEFTED